MLASARAFLAGILDYAGMFPPAKLPLRDALANFLHYRQTSPHAWMLNRFVCPAARLSELSAILRETKDAPHVRITALGQQSRDMDHIPERLEEDVTAIGAFRETCEEAASVDVLEMTFPMNSNAMPPALAVDAIRTRVGAASLRAFLEVPCGPSWRTGVDELSRLLDHPAKSQNVGMKLRCGGTVPEAFPSAEEVAHFVTACRAAMLPWKATAGLHHARPVWDDSLKVWQHGFLNVFVAACLALVHPLRESDIVEILLDRECRHLRFADDEIAWKNWTCSSDQITRVRRHELSSFGSCSFVEPCADLLAMGLIDG